MRAISYWLGLLLIFLIPWERLVHIEGLGTISRIMGVLVAGAWLLSTIGRGVRTPGPFHLAAAIFILWNAISIFWTVEPEGTVERIGTYIRIGLLTLILWDLYRTAESVRVALQAFVFGGIVPALSTISNYVAGVQTEYGRYSTDGDNMNTTAFILALTVPVALYLAIEADRFSSPWWSRLKYLNYCCVLITIFAICLTATRFAILMTVPAWLYAIWMLARSGRLQGTLVIVMMGAGLVGVINFLPRDSVERLVSAKKEVSAGDLNGRMPVWRLGLKSWADHPVLGIGAAASGEPSVAVFGFPKAMHNSFLAVLVELGMIGISLVGAILVITLAHVLQMERSASIFWLCLLSVWFLGNMPLTCFHTKETWLLLGLAIAFPAAPTRSDPSQTE